VHAVPVSVGPHRLADPAVSAYPPVFRGVDTLAVASAVCGFTAVVPIVSQVMGLAFGIASLVRIRRGRRRGVALRGRGWALAGILSSLFVLLCWIVVIAVFATVGSLFSGTDDALRLAAAHGR
jgi:hypothetical protein